MRLEEKSRNEAGRETGRKSIERKEGWRLGRGLEGSLEGTEE